MQLRWGNYFFPVNGVQISTDTRPLMSDAKILYGFAVGMRCHGWLLGAGQSALSILEQQLRDALAVPYKDLVLLQDSGAVSSCLLLNATSLGGVQITNGPNFPGKNGSEFATEREFEFGAEAEYPINKGTNPILTFRETLTFNGGGPIRVAKRALNGPPQIQTPYLVTEYTATQSGSAVGYLDYPIPPGPIFGAALLASTPNLTRESPKRTGFGYKEFGINWSYQFLSASPLVGSPNKWIGT